MSSERGVRNPSTESPRVPGEGYSSQGESGPKARPKGVVDAQLVDIPVPLRARPGLTEVANWMSGSLGSRKERTHFGAASNAGTKNGR